MGRTNATFLQRLAHHLKLQCCFQGIIASVEEDEVAFPKCMLLLLEANIIWFLLNHTDAKSQFLYQKFNFDEIYYELNLNFPAKNGCIENLIF